jgi:hypothetical protein
MPTDACQFFYDCKGCGERLKPLAGDCCVFCSYGSVSCPPIQSNGRGLQLAKLAASHQKIGVMDAAGGV